MDDYPPRERGSGYRHHRPAGGRRPAHLLADVCCPFAVAVATANAGGDQVACSRVSSAWWEVPRPRPLPDDRPRLARGRGGGTGLAQAASTLTPLTPRSLA